MARMDGNDKAAMGSGRATILCFTSNGIGMGLSICRSIIEAHDGMLWVVPNAPRGSMFQFVLGADAASSVDIL